jgi:protein-S-isoprenylcysteine O-methyltransferase Ste14
MERPGDERTTESVNRVEKVLFVVGCWHWRRHMGYLGLSKGILGVGRYWQQSFSDLEFN